MPIYEYRCSNCGFQKEYLQKVSAEPLTVCPECGKETFSKMLTAAGFQLKGSGWYVTDFRNKGSTPATGTATGPKADAKPESKGESKSDSSSSAAPSTESASTPKSDSKPASGSGSSA